MGKREKSEESTLKIIGVLFELIALFVLILVAVGLNMNVNLVTLGSLLVVGVSTFFIGLALLVFSHLPQQQSEGKRKNAK